MLEYFYVNEPRVIICANDNLVPSKFHSREVVEEGGGLGTRLTPHGTSLLAINLKRTVAKALDIQVVRKPTRSYR